MPTLDLDNFNIICALGGGFVGLFCLISYLAKERFYLSEALIAFAVGILFGPGAGWIRPEEYAGDNEETLELLNRNFCRLVLAVQLVVAGIQLPPRYLRTEWRSLAYLLGPCMAVMWIVSSMLIWALVPKMTFLYALAVGACVTPTDPVLSDSIVKGKFADKHLPKALQNLIIAESGSNDGLAYPFLYLPLYLITYVGQGAHGHSAGKPIGMWFYDTWCYEVLLSCVYGAVIGYVAKYLLRWSEERKWIDDEEFLIFAIAMALFIIGTGGLIGTDAVLSCFIAGNVFTWDDWFRVKAQDDSLQPSVDLLLNVAIFVWFGAVCPWHTFVNNGIIPIYRLIPLGILILFLRRPPIVLLLHKRIHQTEKWRQAGIVGFFGPVGVGAIFYLSVSQHYLRHEVLGENGEERPDATRLRETMTVVVWFLVTCSVIVHGLTLATAKLGAQVPRTLADNNA